jgi:geranyl-CoA carboxylase alpha subunit
MSFSKILIANRGEIACRVIRTARRMGYRTVAVFSDADRAAPHVLQADEAVHIGGSPAAESYLSTEALLAAARHTGADAVHPGYGFLSENAPFAQACQDAGLVFIGPPPAAIEAMGDKALAKRRMIDAGVPCAPGYLGEQQDDDHLLAEAHRLGFPLLVKAVAGGGGRGMRLVHAADELEAGIAGARREAQSAFGNNALMLERLIDNGRHIEIQVFADAHGHAVHLGERDCTSQRRRQKVIEEAPSPVVSAAMREAMGRDAVAAALAVGYRGAGTVEFIVDAELKHYFLEMNTRLQVEHPVTEAITGIDLVEWQLRVAAGHPLPLQQQDITFSGHAIEARLYAEDPYAGFAPQTGKVCWWRPAAALQTGVRIDDGIIEGGEVTPFYDPMVAKVIVHGLDREDAIRRLRSALSNSPLLGLRNNARFLSDLVDHPEFRAARMTTTRIDEWQAEGASLLHAPVANDATWALAAAVLAVKDGTGWRPDSVEGFGLPLQCGDVQRSLRVRIERSGSVQVSHGGATQWVRVLELQDGRLRFESDGVIRRGIAVLQGNALHLALDGTVHVFNEVSPFPQQDSQGDASRAVSPVAGKVTQVQVAVGDTVSEGQPLVCVEAMKMEMWMNAQAAGRVSGVHVTPGDQVELNALLVEIELADHKATQNQET